MTSDELERLARKLREKREAAGLTLKDLAGYLGISTHAIARLERREGSPSRATAGRVRDWIGEGGR